MTNNNQRFLKALVDNLPDNIVVINNRGDIVFVNRGWISFGKRNAGTLEEDTWQNFNYLQECEKAYAAGEKFALDASKGINDVINGRKPVFALEYPCHGPSKQRWFMMKASAFKPADEEYVLITHSDITARVLAEQKVRALAYFDSLTNIANRRAFEEFLAAEWRRCERLSQSITLAIIDIDHFKSLNDTYGHQQGDQCLIKVAETLRQNCNRPGDICSRYGGEEFALVWGDTSLGNGQLLAEKILRDIADLKIANKHTATANHLTVSIGLASTEPAAINNKEDLINLADKQLYLAKQAGRNQLKSRWLGSAM